MQETEPLYFTKFREYIDERLNKIDSKLEEVDNKLDYHFEEIGELKVEVTKTNLLLVKKADQKDLEKLDKRVGKVEKLAFV